MNTQQFNTHTPSSLSSLEWKGLHSSKFVGGRFHENHPKDELDSLMMSSKSTERHSQGKKQYYSQQKKSGNQVFKPSLKTYENKYKKSGIFQEQHIQKLIKIPFVDQSSPSRKEEFNSKYKLSTIGKSKIKALQQGIKQTGIYRNFYNSQVQSSNVILAYK